REPRYYGAGRHDASWKSGGKIEDILFTTRDCVFRRRFTCALRGECIGSTSGFGAELGVERVSAFRKGVPGCAAPFESGPSLAGGTFGRRWSGSAGIDRCGLRK